MKKNSELEIALPDDERQPQGQGDLDAQGDDDNENIVPQRLLEDRVRYKVAEVLKSTECRERAHAVPLVQAVHRGLDDGKNDERGK
jgi:hypothetical protein